MLLGSLLDELFNYEMFMELLEGIWGLLALLWQLLKIIVSFAGVLLLMYGISYWFDIRSSLKSYKKAHQDSLKKINELENSEKLSRKSYWDSFDKIKELESAVKKLTPNPYKLPLSIGTYSSNGVNGPKSFCETGSARASILTMYRTVFVVDLVVTFESLTMHDALGFKDNVKGFPKGAFIVYLNGIVAKKDTIDSITCDGSNVIITFNSNLNFSLDSVDEFMITGPLLAIAF